MDSTQATQIELDFSDIDDNMSVTIGSGTLDPLYGAVPPNNWYTTTGTINTNYPSISISPTWTTTGTSGSWTITDTDLVSPSSAKIQLNGEDADIMIGEKSLMQILDGIEQRLGLLKCREDLESEWEELKALGDQYRALVKNIEEKSKMWETLKR